MSHEVKSRFHDHKCSLTSYSYHITGSVDFALLDEDLCYECGLDTSDETNWSKLIICDGETAHCSHPNDSLLKMIVS